MWLDQGWGMVGAKTRIILGKVGAQGMVWTRLGHACRMFCCLILIHHIFNNHDTKIVEFDKSLVNISDPDSM